MPSPYSPYAIHEAGVPKFNPGEEPAASAFVGMTLLLVLEINVELFRMFKRRTGLYYWAITIGSYACGVDAIGIILKFLTPGAEHIWIFYLLIMSIGWATYTVAQLVVLYSRLHLITENLKVRRRVLLLICVASPIVIIADWIVVWPAWNTWDSRMSDEWSPYDAIVERFAQLAFTCVEVAISAIYIHALGKLLRVKSSVRQRRVMLDLSYVVILGVVLDMINVILVFVNRVGLSHPIQTFTYALKLRLEFAVLNQLMAVAARGLSRRGESFAEKRYYNPSAAQNITNFGQAVQPIDFTPTGERSQPDTFTTAVGPSSKDFDSRQLSIPAAVADAFPKRGSDDQVESLQSQKSNSRYPRAKSSQEKMLPKPPQGLKNRTFWRNDDDVKDEEERVILDQWEHRKSKALPIPWFQTESPVP
ncbi:MAG: hypothetical protein Q9225_002878 [Loekoesia sp. 1 TL-2023]